MSKKAAKAAKTKNVEKELEFVLPPKLKKIVDDLVARAPYLSGNQVKALRKKKLWVNQIPQPKNGQPIDLEPFVDAMFEATYTPEEIEEINQCPHLIRMPLWEALTAKHQGFEIEEKN
jgi:hypothetical protein